MGDPDVDPLQNESAGEESPGATTPTPDQNLIDDTGRAYGVAEADSGEQRTSGELLDARDAARVPESPSRPGTTVSLTRTRSAYFVVGTGGRSFS
jgi:hypothetical protein